MLTLLYLVVDVVKLTVYRLVVPKRSPCPFPRPLLAVASVTLASPKRHVTLLRVAMPDSNAITEERVAEAAPAADAAAAPPVATTLPPRPKIDPPAWIKKLRKVQRGMMFFGFPVAALVLALVWYIREVEARTFHVAPWIEGGAVRSILRATGLKEVQNPDAATILWSDDLSTLGGKAQRKRRVSSLPGLLNARADASCTVLTAAALRLERSLAAAANSTNATNATNATLSDEAATSLTAETTAGGGGAGGGGVDESMGGEERAATPMAAPRVATCYVLPRQREALREAMSDPADGGRSFWELTPADALAHQLLLDGSGGAVSIAPAVTNNPDSVPKGGSWAVRKMEPRPLLLYGRRIALQLFGLVSSVDPLRVYLHHDAVIWRAARKYQPEQPHLDVSGEGQRLGPRRVSAGRHVSPLRGSSEVAPIALLWHALAERGAAAATTASATAPTDPHEVWRALERVAVLGVTAALRGDDHGTSGSKQRKRLGSLSGAESLQAGGGREIGALNGYASQFALLSLDVHLDEELVPTVVGVEPLPELADGIRGQPEWHRDAMRRVASDALNLTGATLHPKRKSLFLELRTQLHRALKAKTKKKTPLTANSRARQSKADRKQAKKHMPPGAKGGGKRGAGGMFGREDADKKKAPAQCKLALPVRLHEGESEVCVSAAEVDVLAQADTEWLWRFGWRRIVPGADEDVRAGVRARSAHDALLARYHSRWPKEEDPYSVPLWADQQARLALEDADWSQ